MGEKEPDTDDGIMTIARSGIFHMSYIVLFVLLCLLVPVEDGKCDIIPTVESPGRIDYEILDREPLWDLFDDYPTTTLIAEDMDSDGSFEVIFGTREGRIIVYSPDERSFDLDFSVGARILSMAVGNVDGDYDYEITVSSSKGISCVDYTQKKLQWEEPDIRSAIMISLFDVDEDGQNEVFVYNKSEPDSEHGFVTCLRGDGTIRYSTPLTSQQWLLGPHVSFLFDDIDGDSTVELIVNDRDWSIAGERGCHIWVLDTANGNLELSREFEEYIFSSSAIIYKGYLRPFIFMGLETYANNTHHDIMIYDFIVDISDTYNISNTMEWRYISLIEEDGNQYILLSSNYGDLVYWSITDREISWSYDEGDQNGIDQPPFLCDIDADGQYEVLYSPRRLNILDVSSGELEESLEVRKGYIKNVRTICQDFDGDAYSEIVIIYQDGINQQYYVVFLNSPRQEFMSDDDHSYPMTLYAGKKNNIHFILTNTSISRIPDTIRIRAENPQWGTFCTFRLIFENQSLVWDDNPFLMGDSFSYSFAGRNMSLTIKMVPSWDFSYDGGNTISTIIDGRTMDNMTDTYQDLFIVERDLVFTGGYQLKGLKQGLIVNGSWVSVAEEIVIDNVGVVYEGTTNLEPPIESFNISLQHPDIIEEWSTVSQRIIFLTPDETGPTEFNIKLFQIPLGALSTSELYFILKIDGDAPIVRNFIPENNTWYIDKTTTLGILLDDMGSGLNTSSVKYAVYPYDMGENLEWIIVGPSRMNETPDGHSILDEISIFNGITNISWSASDKVGNRLIFHHQIRFDDTIIQFREFNAPEWSNSYEISCSISVLDLNGSGVDGSSLQYSYAINGIDSFSDWISFPSVANGEEITMNITFMGQEGTRNYIQFRGRDVAGTQHITSKVYNIWVDTTPPVISFEYPEYDSIIPNRTIIARILESGSGIQELDPQLIDTENDERIIVDFTITPKEGGNHLVVFTWNESSSYQFSFDLMCYDGALNLGDSATLRFQENRPPALKILKPSNKQTFFVGEQITLQVEYSDPNDNDIVNIEWSVDQNVVAKGNDITITINQTGIHLITATVKDSFSIDVADVDITVEKRKTSKINQNYIIVVILAVCTLLSVYIYHWKKTRRFEE